MYGHQAKLQPFDVFYKEQLKLRKKANTPDKKSQMPNFDEGSDKFKKGSLVYIDYTDDYQVSRKYNVKRGPIYEISEVNTVQRPFLSKIQPKLPFWGGFSKFVLFWLKNSSPHLKV